MQKAKIICKNCSSTSMVKRGFAKNKLQAFQKYQCKNCKVPIKQGDLLVSANKKGYAMKLDLDNVNWKQATGTVLGKALEECNNEKNIIYAWVG